MIFIGQNSQKKKTWLSIVKKYYQYFTFLFSLYSFLGYCGQISAEFHIKNSEQHTIQQ